MEALTRWYAPTLGRFISEDSLLGSPNDPRAGTSCAYAQGDPVDGWDPGGRLWYDDANRPLADRGGAAGSYTSDTDGRLTSRPNQRLEWDALGCLDRLLTADEGGLRTRYRYIGRTTAVAQIVNDATKSRDPLDRHRRHLASSRRGGALTLAAFPGWLAYRRVGRLKHSGLGSSVRRRLRERFAVSVGLIVCLDPEGDGRRSLLRDPQRRPAIAPVEAIDSE